MVTRQFLHSLIVVINTILVGEKGVARFTLPGLTLATDVAVEKKARSKLKNHVKGDQHL